MPSQNVVSGASTSESTMARPVTEPADRQTAPSTPASRFSLRSMLRDGPPFGLPGDRLREITVAEVVFILLAGGAGVLGTIGLAAAQLGIFGWPALIVGTLALGTVMLAVVLRLGLPKIVLDPIGLVTVVAVVALAAFMFFPGFHFGTGDRDPGVYMEVGAAIARTGSLTLDPGISGIPNLPLETFSPGALWPGLWFAPDGSGTIVPQFYHLWTALLASANLVHGFGAQANLTPLLAVVAVVLAVLIARRLGGPVAALFAGVLLPTMMMQVWQAKYPSSEIIAELLFLGSVLTVVIAVQAKSSSAAFLAGAFTAFGYLARADGILLIILSVCVLALLWVLRRTDRRAGWFLVGLVPLTAFGAYQGYVWAAAYTNGNLPSGKLIWGSIFVVVVIALSLRPLVPRVADRVNGSLDSGRTRFWLTTVIVVLSVLFFIWAAVRPMFGHPYVIYNGREIRSYDEEALHWLSWFFTWPGLVLVIAGIAVLLYARWNSATAVIVVPVALLLPLYVWNARNSPYLMWWGRRFIPILVPSMFILIAVALAAVWLTRSTWLTWVGRVLTIAGVVAMTWVYVGQSVPLRHHDEMGGSYNITANMATLAGDKQGVFLWDLSGACCAAPALLMGGPLFGYHGQISVPLPRKADKTGAYVRAYLKQFSDRPVFLIMRGATIPAPIKTQLDGLAVTPVQRVQTAIPAWEQSSTHRPDHAISYPINLTVYRVTG